MSQHGRKDDLDRLVVVGRPGDAYALNVRFSIDRAVHNADLVINPGKLEDDDDDAPAAVTLGLSDGKGGCISLNGHHTLQPGTYSVVFGIRFAADAHHDQGGVLKLRSGRKTIAKPLPIKIDVLTSKDEKHAGKQDKDDDRGKSGEHGNGKAGDNGNGHGRGRGND